MLILYASLNQDVEAGTVDPVTVRTLHASRQQMISMLERRRRRLRCVLLLTSLMTIGTAALAVFYLAQFLYTYSRALVSLIDNDYTYNNNLFSFFFSFILCINVFSVMHLGVHTFNSSFFSLQHYQGMCQYSFEEPPETQNEAGRLYGRRKEAQIALAGAGQQPMDVELRAGPRQFPPVGNQNMLVSKIN